MSTRRCFTLLLMLFATGAMAQGTNSSPDVIPPEPRPKDSLPLSSLPNPHLYRMNYWVSGGFTAAAFVANVYSIPRIKEKKPLSDGELNNLNTAALNGFERWALHQKPELSGKYDKASDYALQGTILASGLLALDKHVRKDGLRILLMYAETHAVTFSLYNFSPFGPTFQNKLRPAVYYPQIGDEARRSGNNRNSMYSGHTASAACAAFFAAKVYNDYHPEFSFGKKYLIYTAAAIPPLVQGYLRMKALKHFPSDILIGYIIGATCGVAVPEMHRFKKQAIRYGVEMNPNGDGAGLTLRWQPRYERPAVRL